MLLTLLLNKIKIEIQLPTNYMRQILLSDKDIKKIAIYTSQYYQSITQYPLSAKSISAIQYIVARDHLLRQSANPDMVFDLSAHPTLQVYLRALDSQLTSPISDIYNVYNKELVRLPETTVNTTLEQVFSDEEEFTPFIDITDLEAPPQAGDDQVSQHNDEPMLAAESEKSEDENEAIFQVFDRFAFEALYEKSSLYDKEVRRIIKEIDEKDTGFRDLRRVTPKSYQRILALKEKYPNMLPFLDFVDRHVALSAHNRHQEFYMPPVLLVSKPGLGKTACVKDVALALGLPFDFVDYSTSSAAWILVGVSSVWQSAKPGLIFDQLIKQRICNGMILCDEIDKSPDKDKYPPLNVFYKLLEKDMMRDFQDEFIPQLKLDASKIMFVATANTTDTIPEAILSRFHVIHIPQPSKSQLRVIAGSIYRSIIETESYKSFAEVLNGEVVESLLNFSPRQIKVVLKLAFSSAAYRCRHNKNFEPGSITIEPDDIDPADVEADDKQKIGFVWN